MSTLPHNLFNDEDQPQTESSAGAVEENADFLSPVDLLELPADLADIVRLILRSGGLTLAEISAGVSQPPAETETKVKKLVTDGILRQSRRGDEVRYKAKLGRVGQRKRMSDVWSALDDL